MSRRITAIWCIAPSIFKLSNFGFWEITLLLLTISAEEGEKWLHTDCGQNRSVIISVRVQVFWLVAGVSPPLRV